MHLYKWILILLCGLKNAVWLDYCSFKAINTARALCTVFKKEIKNIKNIKIHIWQHILQEHGLLKKILGNTLPIKLWLLYFINCTLYRLIERPWKLRWRKSEVYERRLDGNKLYLLHELFIGIRAEACSFFHSFGALQVSRKGHYERSLSRNLFTTLEKSWEWIILLQNGCKGQVSLCYNESICGFSATAFFLRRLSRLLVIITNKPLLWIMVITVSFKNPSHIHCGA